MRNSDLKIMLILLLTTQFLSCQTIKNIPTEEDNFIAYILPFKTEEALYEKIKPLLSEPVKLGIKFKHDENGWIYIYVNVFRKGYDRDHRFTNRKLFINDTYYPLVFELDYTFDVESKGGSPIWNVSRVDPNNKRNDISTDEKVPPLNEREDLRGIYQREYIIRHNRPILKIDTRGHIIE